MSKEFAKRVTKKERNFIDLSDRINPELLRLNEKKILEGARLQNVKLADISVRKQVRTYFNDETIRELAQNIQENGLIQPLVLHREGNQFVLICGERRFRAMSTLTEMKEAPCFILEGKTSDELMAIQFSENSARENLHYIDHADSIFNYQLATQASERKITAALGVSKTEVHRALLIAKLPQELKEAAKMHDIEKYVLLEWIELKDTKQQNMLLPYILNGQIRKRSEIKDTLKGKKPPLFNPDTYVGVAELPPIIN
ncbi:MAG: ParB/RepB/Spo0J family partition protein [Bacteriovoracaceae bacterium]|nr:ParB/RepB/Spo0J family partition protein [Bacteriovoracaceae bacterium]